MVKSWVGVKGGVSCSNPNGGKKMKKITSVQDAVLVTGAAKPMKFIEG